MAAFRRSWPLRRAWRSSRTTGARWPCPPTAGPGYHLSGASHLRGRENTKVVSRCTRGRSPKRLNVPIGELPRTPSGRSSENTRQPGRPVWALCGFGSPRTPLHCRPPLSSGCRLRARTIAKTSEDHHTKRRKIGRVLGHLEKCDKRPKEEKGTATASSLRHRRSHQYKTNNFGHLS